MVETGVPTKSILLLGATGLVGGECLDQILAGDHFSQVTTLTRRPLPRVRDDSRHVNHVIDFDEPESYRSRVTADIVICALGTTIKKAGSREMFRKVDFDYPYTLSRAALKKGAEHLLLVSAMGAAPGSRFFYNRVKGELEAAVSRLAFKNLSIFRPSLLKGNRREFRAGEEIGNFLAGALSFAIPKKWKPTPVTRLAAAIIRAAVDSRPGIRYYESDEILIGID
jgi:uncharacterized protein YbjT (DUF2867 family)